MESVMNSFGRYSLTILLLGLIFMTILGGVRKADQDRYQHKCIIETQEDILETQRVIKEQQETIARMKKALIGEMERRDEDQRRRIEKGGK